MHRVRVPEQWARGFYLTDMGQRVHQWLPAGIYTRLGSLARVGQDDCVKVCEESGATWYVAPSVFDTLKPVA